MTDLLRKEQAPLSDAAWKLIEQQTQRTLKGNLSARGLVDFSGPHGWDLAAVNNGRLEAAAKEYAGVRWSLRQAQPLVEIRIPFTLNIWEMDNAGRGAKNADLEPLYVAARKAAVFEEAVIYKGLDPACIRGILGASPHKAVAWKKNAGAVGAAGEAVLALQKAGAGGPYALVLGTELFAALNAEVTPGGPARKVVEELTGAPVRWSPALEGGALVSLRGGDYELTVGQDFALGYAHRDNQTVALYLAESFTFQVHEPCAALEISR